MNGLNWCWCEFGGLERWALEDPRPSRPSAHQGQCLGNGVARLVSLAGGMHRSAASGAGHRPVTCRGFAARRAGGEIMAVISSRHCPCSWLHHGLYIESLRDSHVWDDGLLGLGDNV